MSGWQKIIVAVYGLYSLYAFYKGCIECIKNKNPFGLANQFNILGIFVWGDAIVVGLVWFIGSIIAILVNDWILFLLALSVYWLIRGVGETIYWLNQQFSNLERNPPHTLRFNNIFPSDSIWFIYQLIWQLITIFSIVSTLYLTKIWFKG